MCKKLLFLGLIVASLMVGCSGGEAEKYTTPSGVEVTYLRKGDGPVVADSSIMMLHMLYFVPDGDTIFNTYQQGRPVPLTFLSSASDQGMLYEPLSIMKKGDSMLFDIPTNDLFEKTFGGTPPPSMADAPFVRFNVSLHDILSTDEYDNYLLNEDLVIIDKFLNDNNINAQKTDSGLRYVITEEGDGELATAGQKVTVHYNGTLLDGTKFDSSYDRDQPFSFVLGKGNVIRGWDEGLALLNKGSKATLYIPSSLAYGANRVSPVIAPYSILKFDVELLELE